MTGRRRGRFGLRTRLTAAFGLGGLLFATILAGLTYTLARNYLLRQRETVTANAARANATAVAAGLRTANTDLPSLLDALGHRSGSEALVLLDGELFGSAVTETPQRLPASFVDAVREGRPVRQRFRRPDATYLAVGLPLGDQGTGYIEVFSLAELERTLGTLGSALLAAATVTSVGFGALGYAVSARVLRPVRGVAAAATAIAHGRLDTRLDVGGDRDLLPLASSFNAMADALQARIERDARFAGDVSHELRSPLTTLSASFSVLQAHRDELPPRPARAVDLIGAELDRFQRLVEDLLEISRADAGLLPELEPVGIADLVAHAVHRSAYARVPVDVGLDAPVVVLADKRRFERTLVNLLDNARRHGGGPVRVGVCRAGDTVRVEVDDAGPGVPPEERGRIFERFARGRTGAARGSAGGVGLGLALVAEHARAHGGCAYVEDRPGGGARFVVELPVAR